MRTKSWPFWETWKCIFGKDCACGGGAEQLPDAADRVRAQVAGGSQVNENDYCPVFDDSPPDATGQQEFPDMNQDISSTNSDKEASTNKPGSLKRKCDPTDAPLMEFLSTLHAETNNRLEVIAARIGYEFDLGKHRQEVFDKLGMVDGLSLEQRYDLCNILGDKPQRLEVFIGMPPNARLGYLLRLIEDSRKGV